MRVTTHDGAGYIASRQARLDPSQHHAARSSHLGSVLLPQLAHRHASPGGMSCFCAVLLLFNCNCKPQQETAGCAHLQSLIACGSPACTGEKPGQAHRTHQVNTDCRSTDLVDPPLCLASYDDGVNTCDHMTQNRSRLSD